MLFRSEINQIPVCAFIDSGSTHSFINPYLVNNLALETQQTPTLQVKIANGAKMSTNQLCPNLNFKLQNHDFETDLRVLDINGFDLLLGMDWLSSMSPMFLDWKRGIMKMRRNFIV